VICVSMNQLAASLPFRYIHKNLSPEVRRLAGFIFHLLAYMSETSCFALLGLSVFLLSYPAQHWVFMLSVVALSVLARPLAVYPLLIIVSGQYFTWIFLLPVISLRVLNYSSVTAQLNLYRAYAHTSPAAAGALHGTNTPSEGTRHLSESNKSGGSSAMSYLEEGGAVQAQDEKVSLPLTEPLSSSAMHVIAFAGMRGAVSYSLAYVFPDDNGNRYMMTACSTWSLRLT
jgi:NhaP-type Na+/H+ or K+/H+ antiporter